MATLQMVIDARQAKLGAAEFNQAAASMKQGAASTSSAIEQSFKRAMNSIVLLATGGGVMHMLDRMVDAAARAQQTANRFNVLFRDQAGQAGRWAEDFGDSVGRSTQDVQDWMAGIQGTLVPLGLARDKAADLSKSLVTLAADVASFNSKTEAEVIQDFTSAMTGNTEAMRKYGVVLSDRVLDQEALSEGLGKGLKDLTELEKVQLRYNVIEKATLDAQGDAIRNVGGYANQVERLKANWEELSTTIGGVAIPVLEKLLVATNKFIDDTDTLDRGWKNLSFSFTERFTNAFGRPEDIAAWTLALREYNTEMGKWSQVGPGGMFNVPSDMERFEQLLQHFRSGALTNLPEGRLDIAPDRLRVLQEMERSARESQEGSPTAGVISPLSDEQIRSIIEGARDAMESVRHQDYLTRMERIENLEAYRDAHANVMYDVVGKETEAGKLIRNEIESLQRSRVDAMKVYQAELREDFQNLALYRSEKEAEVARLMEGSMSNAFDSMISKGATFRDAMSQFFTDVAGSFSRMASDMLARALMMKVMGIFTGNLTGIGGEGGEGSSVNIAGSSFENPGAVFGAPVDNRFGNIFDRGRVVKFGLGGVLGNIYMGKLMGFGSAWMSGGGAGPIAIGPSGGGRGLYGLADDEEEKKKSRDWYDWLKPALSAYGNLFDRGRIVPMQAGGIYSSPTYFPLAGGKIGLMGEAGAEAIMPLRRTPSGRLGVETSGQASQAAPQVIVRPRVIIVKNEKAAALEAMRSDEGEAIIINTTRMY